MLIFYCLNIGQKNIALKLVIKMQIVFYVLWVGL